MMNAYFSSIGTTLAAQLPAHRSVLQIETGRVADSTDIPTLTVIDIYEGIVKSKILSLKTNKATGPDEVVPRLLRLLGETVIVDHVLNSNRLVTDNQWAYRKGYSTELLLVHLTETWRHSIDSGYVVGVAFIDFKKAFDCVDHDILLNKLRCQFGMRGCLLN